MKLNTLTPAKGSVKSDKRIARGQGSGKGGTSTRGHKGAKSRSGYSRKLGFEGGQMPMQRRLPKFGFNNPNRVEYKGVNINILQTLADKGITDIDSEVLVSNGVVSKNDLVKILATGELKSKINVKVNAISSTAKEAIEKVGGTIELV